MPVTEIGVLPATPAHAEWLAPRLRAADAFEVRAMSGSDPLTAVRRGLILSSEAWTGTVDGRPVCLFGVAPRSLLADVAAPWLLGTDEISAHARAFLRRNRSVVARWHSQYRRLENLVWAENAAAIHWLGWLGFTLGEPLAFNGVNWRPFAMERGHV
jgi:hypothetical protein